MSSKAVYAIYGVAVGLVSVYMILTFGWKETIVPLSASTVICLPVIIIANNFAKALVDTFEDRP